ncbi:glutathione S-transferase family protein [Escherichia fergusonii]|uniref:Glutathione S-transferase family protein n=1 Tax=Escherichia fergusonii (strain ATCC 35469 / DSM 13698 / CCUG 18766 / IAM 14443 / JCM 21226 / LMG 7866 / NBRC 102419 / NCTC 12128 / CDC 0568-73) TaxID=585054 RepID=B7LRE4_ESCF3|nr:glutathione S-transferase family protein [Escherichia fergusonii]EGO8188539.1 glutathione S-transferase family protein [Escherichia fergusonii]EHG5982330.1 glutathione S-transferase family protein [Escherichia fergusonii]EHG5992634.1 glutathione S-transferase family protein [Escherichia fergusonii]EHG6152888.1 glutathione S-transferase family protein [Escherichia fergusonii]EHG6211921.1 glutathione S-transferase family protein [Escherichia fergusonii]
MKIYTYPKSRSLRVLWVLEEIGVTYEAIKVDLFNRGSNVKSPHPLGKVPFLIDEEVSISETLAICIYLCEKHQNFTLYPANLGEKASVNSWLSFSLTDLEAPVWGLLKHIIFTPENQRSTTLMNYFREEADKVISQIHFNSAHTWIAGNYFTLADIFLSHTLQWAKVCGLDINAETNSYIVRTMSRPAFVKAQERNNF